MNRKEAENYIGQKIIVLTNSGTYAGNLIEVLHTKPWRGKWKVSHVLEMEYIFGLGYHGAPWAENVVLENGAISLETIDERIKKIEHQDGLSFYLKTGYFEKDKKVLNLIKRNKINYWESYDLAAKEQLAWMNYLMEETEKAIKGNYYSRPAYTYSKQEFDQFVNMISNHETRKLRGNR
jgi:hypothetical protein